MPAQTISCNVSRHPHSPLEVVIVPVITDELPSQSSWVGLDVDVSTPQGARIGTGVLVREDMGEPWITHIKMNTNVELESGRGKPQNFRFQLVCTST